MEQIATSLPTPEPASQQETVPSVGGDYTPHTPLLDMFAIDGKGNERTQKALATIWSWAEEHAESKASEHVSWQVRKLMLKLGDSPYGFPPYMKVLNYVTTYNTMQEAEKRLRQLEHA